MMAEVHQKFVAAVSSFKTLNPAKTIYKTVIILAAIILYPPSSPMVSRSVPVAPRSG